LCLREAMEGGDSLLVSVETIYNRMRAARPDLLALLFDPIATDRRGEVPEGMKPFMEIPPLSWHAGHLTVFYQRQYIDSAQRFPDAMRLTPDHVAALDMFDGLANDPALHLKMRLRPGDMQFVYNHGQLHDRTGFRLARPGAAPASAAPVAVPARRPAPARGLPPALRRHRDRRPGRHHHGRHAPARTARRLKTKRPPGKLRAVPVYPALR
jgi:hypothetical protein